MSNTKISGDNSLYGNVSIALADDVITPTEVNDIVAAAKTWGGVTEYELDSANLLANKFYDVAMSYRLVPGGGSPGAEYKAPEVIDWHGYATRTEADVRVNQAAVTEIARQMQSARANMTPWDTFVQRLMNISL
jgi:hypothetical protein